jgi:hypothetical protein
VTVQYSPSGHTRVLSFERGVADRDPQFVVRAVAREIGEAAAAGMRGVANSQNDRWVQDQQHPHLTAVTVCVFDDSTTQE